MVEKIIISLKFSLWVYFNDLVHSYVYLLNLIFIHIRRHTYLSMKLQAVIYQ